MELTPGRLRLATKPVWTAAAAVLPGVAMTATPQIAQAASEIERTTGFKSNMSLNLSVRTVFRKAMLRSRGQFEPTGRDECARQQQTQ
jgi:hypothetical protein